MAEILSLLIKTNPNIVGFILNGDEFKLTQFADDTTLILDGTQHSLQSALNTIEIFGNFSGLRMNKEKTKVVWLGKKKLSKDKLNVSEQLDWGKSEFTLLGIDFSTNIKAMSDINYGSAVQKIKAEIRKWESRALTPLGKITVIKTLLLSKIIHLLTSLPTHKSMLDEINRMFYQFLWSKKPDKISRQSICMDFCDGGLKMINIYDFEKSLKVGWIRKIIFDQKSQWYKLLTNICGSLDNLLIMGGEWCCVLSKKVKNNFWADVFESWQLLTKKLNISTEQEIAEYCIWNNYNISREKLYFSKWFKKGIHLVGDIIDING